MNFSNLDVNGLIAFGAGIVGLINTIIIVRANAAAKVVATETQEIVKKNDIKSDAIAKEAKKQRSQMASLLDDTLRRNGKRK